jgi:L-iditol 2-dehydrogenase
MLPETMRALVLSGTGFDHLAVREVPVPRPGPGEVLVRVDAAGICTSLVKLIEQGPAHAYLYGWDVAAHPIILGDEGSVTVVACGAGMADACTVGGRYVVQPAVDAAPVNHRERYRDHAAGVAKVAAGHTLPGHLAEYMLIPEEVFTAKCLVPVPDDGLAYAHTALAEPISCCVSGQLHHVRVVADAPDRPRRAVAGLKAGGVTVVVGLGAMGRMHVDVALAAGPRAIVAADRVAARRAKTVELFGAAAEAAGVKLIVTDGGAELAAAVDDETGRGGADDVIVAVGVGPVIEEAQMLTGRAGVLNLFGGLKHGEHVIGLDANWVHYRETVVTGSSGGNAHDVAVTLALMAEGRLVADAHIARIGDLAHAPGFIDDVRHRRLDGKAIVYPHRRINAPLAVDRWTAADEAALLAP